MDHFVSRDIRLDHVPERDELLMPVALHAASQHRATKNIEGGKQGRCSMPLIVMGHGHRVPVARGCRVARSSAPGSGCSHTWIEPMHAPAGLYRSRRSAGGADILGEPKPSTQARFHWFDNLHLGE